MFSQVYIFSRKLSLLHGNYFLPNRLIMKKTLTTIVVSTALNQMIYAQSPAIATAASDSAPENNTGSRPRIFGGADLSSLTWPQKKKAMRGASGNYGGFDFRLFKPSARIFFDTGSDDDGEVDIFQDGNISASIDLVNLVYRWNTGFDFINNSDSTLWYGLSAGFGITAPADDSEDGTEEASDAPVLLLTFGGFLEYDLSTKTSVLIEGGYALGFTSDESFGDRDDGALYFGLSLNFDL